MISTEAAIVALEAVDCRPLLIEVKSIQIWAPLFLTGDITGGSQASSCCRSGGPSLSGVSIPCRQARVSHLVLQARPVLQASFSGSVCLLPLAWVSGGPFRPSSLLVAIPIESTPLSAIPLQEFFLPIEGSTNRGVIFL